MAQSMKAAELLVRCLENEDVDYIFGIPGEENIDVMDALLGSSIRFITTRHEQGAAFMADVYGRLTGRAGVCLSTLGPGATNLITGSRTRIWIARRSSPSLARLPRRGCTRRSHQHLDLVSLFAPITKYSTQIREPEIIPEVVRKAFKQALTEKPGVSFIDFPENVAGAQVEGKQPLAVQAATTPEPAQAKVEQAAEIISGARHPIIMAGNGIIRAGATDQLQAFAEKLQIPVATTFMAKGAIPDSHPLSLGTVGLQAHD
jgi:acetolactate synthase-1/2/3 large subunit